MRFDANLKWLFTEEPPERRFATAAEHGFEAVEMASPYPYRPEEVRRWLTDSGLQMVLINSPGGAAGSPTAYGNACHPQTIPQFRHGFELALEYAETLGAPMVHLMAGVVPESTARDVAMDTYLGNLSWAAEKACHGGVTVLVEVLNRRTVPGFLLRSLADASDAISQAGGDRTRLLFDFYNTQVNEGDLTTRWREFSSIVGHVQVADSPDRHEPGTGELNWDYLFREITSSAYDGWIGCEYEPSTTTVDGLGWRQRYAQGLAGSPS